MVEPIIAPAPLGDLLRGGAFSIGVEEEYQIVDPETGELKAHIQELLPLGRELLGDQIKPEVLQSVVEANTRVCRDVGEVRAEITRLRAAMAHMLARAGLRMIAPGTGIPERFASWSEFENYVNLLVQTNCIDSGRRVWWDLRPHPLFNTLEFRVCDMPATADETIALAALCQALVAKLYKLRMQNLGFRMYSRALIEENKWRAARYGLDGKLIDFGKQQEVPMRDLVVELLDFVDDVVDDLGSRAELQTIRRIVEAGTGADRQIAVYTATQSTRAVVDWLCEETLRGIAL